jgi:hypothetical protein
MEASGEKMEANQEGTEAVAEHYEGVPCAEATQGWVSSVLHGDPKGGTYEETIRALEDRFGEQHLVIGYHNQLKIWTQDDGDPCRSLPPSSNK